MQSTFIVENTLQFSELFWGELLHMIKIDGAVIDCFDYCETVSDLKDCAFNEDHHEWLGSWLFDGVVQPLLQKHNVNGHLILDSEGDLYAYVIENGVPSRRDVKLSVASAFDEG